MLNPLCHSIFTHTKDQKAAKDFLRWLMAPKQAGPLVRHRGHLLPAVPARL